MKKELHQFMDMKLKSKASIINNKIVEVIDPSGEIYHIICGVGKFIDSDTRSYQLHLIEYIFDKNFSHDKENMVNLIWKDSLLYGLTILGISSGDRQGDRLRIGQRIREIREARDIEAKDLAKLASIDAANLSRIENGKYSVGIDILSKIAAVLGMKIDFVDIKY